MTLSDKIYYFIHLAEISPLLISKFMLQFLETIKTVMLEAMPLATEFDV